MSTTIAISAQTRKRIGKFATKEESFDDAVNRALDIAENAVHNAKERGREV